MNQRIRELAKEAEVSHGGMRVVDIEKFAELIVLECIDVVDVGGEFVSRPKMVERIKEHFGVADVDL